MREMLFKGKRVDNGEWVEGYYVYDESGQNAEKDIAFIYRLNKHPCGYALIPYEVLPETVGQYTGLTDKNGKRIFEGDMLESRASENPEDWKQWLCVYQDGSFCFEAEFGKRKKKYEQNLLCKDDVELYGLVIIGTIHDNPELIGGGNDA